MARIVITGPERGLGLELARIYAGEGHEVIGGCLHPDADEIQALAHRSPSLAILPLDVTSEGSVAAFADTLMGKPLDVLINNAGIHRRKGSVPESVVFSDWEETLRVNTLGPARVSFALRGNLKRASGAKLVMISSNRASISQHWGTAYDYCSSKAAANSVMRGLALNWAKDGITVLMIHPGHLRTRMGGADAPILPDEGARRVKALIERTTAADNGRYMDTSGHDLPW